MASGPTNFDIEFTYNAIRIVTIKWHSVVLKCIHIIWFNIILISVTRMWITIQNGTRIQNDLPKYKVRFHSKENSKSVKRSCHRCNKTKMHAKTLSTRCHHINFFFHRHSHHIMVRPWNIKLKVIWGLVPCLLIVGIPCFPRKHLCLNLGRVVDNLCAKL